MLFAPVRICWVLKLVFDVVSIVQSSLHGVLRYEIVNGLLIAANAIGVEVQIGRSSHIVPRQAIKRGVRCAPRR